MLAVPTTEPQADEEVVTEHVQQIDPARKVTGLIMTQVLPFADPRVLTLYGRFEASVYEALKTG